MQIYFAEDERPGARIVHQTPQRDRNPFARLDALLDLRSVFGLAVLQLQFEMREDSKQWIIDLVSCAQRQLRERGIFLVLRKLGLKLALFLAEFSFFREAAKQLLHGRIALFLELL